MKEFSPRTRRELNRFLKFGVVGILGAVVDFGTFNLLTGVLGVWSLLASIISFVAAVTSNFVWNRFWTYPDSRSKPVMRQAVQFGLINLVGLAIRTPIFAYTEKPLTGFVEKYFLNNSPPTFLGEGFAWPAAEGIGSNFALATAVIIVLFWNFGANRVWTYSDAEAAS
jgi:putative flippase GtrA